ncbi:MAG: GAF domain-containing protein [Gammaproteobacteria bacterium]|nr:GAF domain-containing protein [Gammaproteobacteria bacterium]
MNPANHNLLHRINLLNNIGISLSTEKNSDRLLEKILLGAKELTDADGGTLYLLVNESFLKMEIVRTKSLNFAMGGTTDTQIPFEPIPIYLEDGRPNDKMVVTRCVLEGRTISIPDAYNSDEYDFSGTYAFDKKTGYHSQSFLTIPMKNHENDIIGVLQLINAKDSASGETRVFTEEDQQLAESLASQAAVALTNKQLIDGMKELFDALVKMIASTIDEKSAHTGNHCRRIPILTMMLADAVNRTQKGPFANFKISDDELYQLETAAWLHDCGKLTTPDRVMEKSKKLEMPIDRIELVKARFEILKRDIQLELLKNSNQSVTDAITGDELDQKLKKIEEELELIEKTNTGAEFTPDENIQAIASIAEQYSVEIDGMKHPILTKDEIHHLSINKGTITQDERDIINNHIVVTIKMLESLPFPKHLSQVPEFAGGHHERVDGKGFPKGLTRDEMSVPARIMAIADIFEALTANDRPYKSPMKLSMAIRILDDMSRTGHIDRELYEVFIDERVHLDYAHENLDREQIDL